MKYIIIPARMASRRLPGKPLIRRNGRTLLQYVYEECLLSKKADGVFIATSDHEIADEAMKFAKSNTVIFTDDTNTGTERVFLAAVSLPRPQYIINVQCEFMVLWAGMLDAMFEDLENEEEEHLFCNTFAFETTKPELIDNTNRVKVVLDRADNAMYFSRHPIPHGSKLKRIHVGIYGFNYYQMTPYSDYTFKCSQYLDYENLEQLAWLERGTKIHTLFCNDIQAIDTLEDARKAGFLV